MKIAGYFSCAKMVMPKVNHAVAVANPLMNLRAREYDSRRAFHDANTMKMDTLQRSLSEPGDSATGFDQLIAQTMDSLASAANTRAWFVVTAKAF